jgi:hypothetical protein
MRRTRSLRQERPSQPTSLEVAKGILRVHLTLASEQMVGRRSSGSPVQGAAVVRLRRRRGA